MCYGLQQMHDLPHVHLPAAKVPKSPNLSTSPLSSHSVVPLYDGSWPAHHRPEQAPASARQLFQQPDGVRRLLSPCLTEAASQSMPLALHTKPAKPYTVRHMDSEPAQEAPGKQLLPWWYDATLPRQGICKERWADS